MSLFKITELRGGEWYVEANNLDHALHVLRAWWATTYGPPTDPTPIAVAMLHPGIVVRENKPDAGP